MTSTLTLALRARNTSRIKPRYQICLIHPFDPRGQKVGGLETYIRDFITFHPVDTDILFIGVDSTGELELGKLHRLTFRGRGFDFLPILHYSDQQAREAARTHPHLADRPILHGAAPPLRPDRKADPRQAMLGRSAAR